jgi:hypothetical protein
LLGTTNIIEFFGNSDKSKVNYFMRFLSGFSAYLFISHCSSEDIFMPNGYLYYISYFKSSIEPISTYEGTTKPVFAPSKLGPRPSILSPYCSR